MFGLLRGEGTMIYLAIISFAVAVLAWGLGFGAFLDSTVPDAKVIFFIAVLLLVLSIVGVFTERRRLPMD